MIQHILDNVADLRWRTKGQGSLDMGVSNTMTARCGLTGMVFNLQKGPRSVKGVFKDGDSKTQDVWFNLDAAMAAADTARAERLTELLMQPPAIINHPPLEWVNSPDHPNTWTAVCPITDTTFKLVNTAGGYMANVEGREGALGPSFATSDLLQSALETWRKNRILSDIRSKGAHASSGFTADEDAVVWATKEGQDTRMFEITDLHLEYIIFHLKNQKNDTEKTRSLFGGSMLVEVDADLAGLDAQIDMFTRDAEARGLVREPEVFTP